MKNNQLRKGLFSVIHSTYFESTEDVRLTARVLKYLGSRFLYIHLLYIIINYYTSFTLKNIILINQPKSEYKIYIIIQKSSQWTTRQSSSSDSSSDVETSLPSPPTSTQSNIKSRQINSQMDGYIDNVYPSHEHLSSLK